MIWVCRAGVNSVYLDKFIVESKVYLPWEGFNTDLRSYKSTDEYKTLIIEEKGEHPRTSLSNWAGQLFSLCHAMQKGDYVLIPHKGSRAYTFARITGDYNYCANAKDKLYHSRQIRILMSGIPREVFSQSLQYSLGAFRTIFKVRQEEELLATLRKIRK